MRSQTLFSRRRRMIIRNYRSQTFSVAVVEWSYAITWSHTHTQKQILIICNLLNIVAVWNMNCKEYINTHNLLKRAMIAVWNVKCKEYINMHNLENRGLSVWQKPKDFFHQLFIRTMRVMVCRYSCVETQALPGSSQVVILIVATLVNYY